MNPFRGNRSKSPVSNRIEVPAPFRHLPGEELGPASGHRLLEVRHGTRHVVDLQSLIWPETTAVRSAKSWPNPSAVPASPEVARHAAEQRQNYMKLAQNAETTTQPQADITPASIATHETVATSQAAPPMPETDMTNSTTEPAQPNTTTEAAPTEPETVDRAAAAQAQMLANARQTIVDLPQHAQGADGNGE